MNEMEDYNSEVMKILKVSGFIDRIAMLNTITSHFVINSMEDLNDDGQRMAKEIIEDLAKIIGKRYENVPPHILMISVTAVLNKLGQEVLEIMAETLKKQTEKVLGATINFQIQGSLFEL